MKRIDRTTLFRNKGRSIEPKKRRGRICRRRAWRAASPGRPRCPAVKRRRHGATAGRVRAARARISRNPEVCRSTALAADLRTPVPAVITNSPPAGARGTF